MTDNSDIMALKVALVAMSKEIAEELLSGRHAVVSQADRNIATALARLAETLAYGTPRTPKRAHHHGVDDPTGLPSTLQQEAERNAALAKLTPSEKRALGFPG